MQFGRFIPKKELKKHKVELKEHGILQVFFVREFVYFRPSALKKNSSRLVELF